MAPESAFAKAQSARDPQTWSPAALLKREQRLEPCSYLVKHASRSLTYKTRSSLLPGGAAQLVGLHNASDLVAVRYRYVKTPIAITPRNRAGDAAAGQLIKNARR